MRRVAGAVLILATLAACAAERGRDPAPGRATGLAALASPPQASSAGPRIFVSPSGTPVVEGTVDELGWVLPLDRKEGEEETEFERPRPRPSRVEAAAAPGQERGRPLDGPDGGPESELRLGPDDGRTQNETAIDYDGDVVIAGWNSFTATGAAIGIARSTDRGESWGFALRGGFDVMSDPAIAAGGSGRWYSSFIARGGAAGSDLDIFVERSTDDGDTWQPPVAVTADTNFDDKSYVAAREDEVLVGYADFGVSPAKIHAARSTNGGVSFDHDTILANASVGGNGASPVIAPDGTFYVFWRDSFQQFLWMSRSTDSGATWTPDASIVAMHPLPASVPAGQGGYRLLNLPSAAAAPDGALVVVWNDQLLGDADILAIRSTNQGEDWSAPVRVNDDPSGSLQFFPWVAIDALGYVHVVWYDRRHDDADLDVYYALSIDGGASFRANRRLTQSSFTPVLPTEGGAAAFIGDYNGISAGPAGVFPFYQDSRRGEQDVWVARLPSAVFLDGFETGDIAAWTP
jgi:hypothetical protein